MPLNALMMPTTVPNSPTNGAVEPMVARLEMPRFSSACTMASARSRARLRRLDLFARNIRAHLMSAEFLQTGHHDLGQVALADNDRRS